MKADDKKEKESFGIRLSFGYMGLCTIFPIVGGIYFLFIKGNIIYGLLLIFIGIILLLCIIAFYSFNIKKNTHNILILTKIIILVYITTVIIVVLAFIDKYFL